MSYIINTNLSSSSVYTVTSPSATTGNLSFQNYNSNITWATSSTDLTGATLQVNGNANFEGDIKVQGKSIVDSLKRIEERLAILRPNTELEEKWDKLRGLRQAYMELEAEIKEKEQIWATLKK